MQKKYEIDPVTGLRLEVLDPLPSQHTAIESSLMPAEQGATPAPPTPMVIEPFDPAREDAKAQVRAGGEAQPYKGNFFDKLIRTVAGTPDAKLEQAGDAEGLKERQNRRRSAAAASKSAAENPGEAYMEIPTLSSGKGLGESLDGPLQFIASLFGGGKGGVG